MMFRGQHGLQLIEIVGEDSVGEGQGLVAPPAQFVSSGLVDRRRQALRLENIDVNRVVTRFESVLRRTMSEHHQLRIELAPEELVVRVDPQQIDQYIAVDGYQALAKAATENTTIVVGTAIAGATPDDSASGRLAMAHMAPAASHSRRSSRPGGIFCRSS